MLARSPGRKDFLVKRLRSPISLVLSMFLVSGMLGQTPKHKPQVPADLQRFIVGDPPQASARVTLPSNSRVTNNVELGAAAKVLSEDLRNRGYADQKWFVVSYDKQILDGVAVMTRLERIDDTGAPVADNRFSQEPFNPRIKSLKDYFEHLLVNGSKGKYRAFFFYLTLDSSPRQQAPPRVEDINNAFVSGASGGPDFEKMNVYGPFSCTAYVYLFERDSSEGGPRFITNDSLNGQDHLVHAGLWAQMGPQ